MQEPCEPVSLPTTPSAFFLRAAASTVGVDTFRRERVWRVARLKKRTGRDIESGLKVQTPACVGAWECQDICHILVAMV